MWDYLIALLVGAAIPLISMRFQSKEKRRYFELESKDKLKLVAIERRLEAHQQAYAMWYRLIWVIHASRQERAKVITEARNFWTNNCLYLEKNTRKEFDIIIKLVDDYSDKLEMGKRSTDAIQKEKISKDFMGDWERIFELQKLIQKEVELEAITIDVNISPEK